MFLILGFMERNFDQDKKRNLNIVLLYSPGRKKEVLTKSYIKSGNLKMDKLSFFLKFFVDILINLSLIFKTMTGE